MSVRAPSSRKHGAISVSSASSLDRRAGKLRLGVGGKLLRADERDPAVLGVVADQRAGIFARDRRLGAEHRDASRDRGGASRLDRRHSADERHREAPAQTRAALCVEAVLQAMTTMSGRCAPISSPISPATRATRRFLGHRAVGEGRVIGDIDEIGARPRCGDLAMDGEPAESGIKDQDGFPPRHCGREDTEESGAGNRFVIPLSGGARGRSDGRARCKRHSRCARRRRRIFNVGRQPLLLRAELGPDFRHFQEGFANVFVLGLERPPPAFSSEGQTFVGRHETPLNADQAYRRKVLMLGAKGCHRDFSTGTEVRAQYGPNRGLGRFAI